LGWFFVATVGCGSDRPSSPSGEAGKASGGGGTAGNAGGNSAGQPGTAGGNGSGAAGGSAATASGGSGAAAGSHGGAGAGGATGGSSSVGGTPSIRLEDCTGQPDGTICDPAAGFVSASAAFCAHEVCHLLKDFVVQCWNLVPTCEEGKSYGVFDYQLVLAEDATCPENDTCTTSPLVGKDLAFTLIDCGKVMLTDCIASELSSGAMSSAGTHQGKVRCRSFTLEETYCLP